MNWETLRKNLKRDINHTSEWDKHPSVTTRGTEIHLDWQYSGHKIKAVSEDYTLISVIQDAIKIYLEETEKKEE